MPVSKHGLGPMTMSRRAMLRVTGLSVAGVAAGLSGCGGGGESATSSIRMTWWGDDTRQKLMNEVVARYSRQNSGMKITREAAPWGGYWDKLATQMAGHAAPDWLMMDQTYLGDYAQRHALADLDRVVGRALDISAVPKALLDSGRIDGKLYVVPLALNTQIVLYNVTTLRRLGIKVPRTGIDWDQFAHFSKEVAAASGGKLAGTANMGWDTSTLEVWLRGHGKELYAADGKSLACTADDLTAWWSYWMDLQKAGGTVTPELQSASNAGTDADDVVVKGRALATFNWSPQWQNLAALLKDEITGGMLPQGSEGTGQFVKAASYYCSPATTKNLDRAARLASFFINDEATAKALGLTLGVPATAKARAAISTGATGSAKATIEYVDEVERTARPQAHPWPKGTGQVSDALMRAHEDLSFGRVSIEGAVERVLSEGNQALRR